MLAPQEVRTFFVTTVTANRRRVFQVDSHTKLLLDVMAENRAKGRLLVHSFVVMPDHVHLLLTPAYEVPLEKAMQYIKGGFSFRHKSRFPVWESSFMEHRIKDASDYVRHVEYIEANPVRAKLAVSSAEFPFSSAFLRDAIDPAPEHFRRRRPG